VFVDGTSFLFSLCFFYCFIFSDFFLWLFFFLPSWFFPVFWHTDCVDPFGRWILFFYFFFLFLPVISPLLGWGFFLRVFPPWLLFFQRGLSLRIINHSQTSGIVYRFFFYFYPPPCYPVALVPPSLDWLSPHNQPDLPSVF